MSSRSGRLKSYKYPRPSQRRADVTRLNRPKALGRDEDPLSGIVHGLKASDIEERFARALEFNRKEYAFQVPLRLPGSIYQNQVDFIVEKVSPVEIYGEIGHDSQAEKEKDAIREILINQELRKSGMLPIVAVWWWELENQDMANNKVRNLFF